MTATQNSLGLRDAAGTSTAALASRHAPQLRIESRIDGAVAHVLVTGELDMATDHVLRDALAIATPRAFHLDLSGVAFMSCSTLTVLFEAAARHAARGQTLTICAASMAARRVLRTTNLQSLIAA